jgi:hypothetical protein
MWSHKDTTTTHYLWLAVIVLGAIGSIAVILMG